MGAFFWITVPYKEGYLWRFGVYYCLLLQVDWTCLWWTLRKMLENNLCLYRKHWHNFGLPNPWLTERSPNFPIQSTFPFHLLQPPEPEWVSLKIQTLCSSERSAKALAMQFETPCLISIQHVSLCTHSQVSTVTIYWRNGPGFEFCQGQYMLSCPKLHRPWMGFTQPCFKGTRVLSWGRGKTAGNSTTSRVEFKNEWSYTIGPPYAAMTWTGTTSLFQLFKFYIHLQEMY